jgi:sigma-B regulation protein RsbU (phosphoserine phosphatase)
VREISSGNLDKKIDVHTNDEIEHLAICFNAMTDELKTYMVNLEKETAERERIATELDVATDIQNGMLPKDFPARADFELFATMTPAKEVGGDFYDFYFLDEKHLAITVADVSGKGIPAALFMVISKTILSNFAETFYKQNDLAQVVAASNEQLCANNEAMMFVTAFIGVLDLESGEFTFVNAGHNPPVVYRAETNHCEFLDVKKNFVLGGMDGIPFVEQKINFKHGDLIFIYTDGVTEALNVKEEEYLPDRLINFMNSTDCAADLETLLANVRADLSKHVGDAEQSDDITMFALRFKGKS